MRTYLFIALGGGLGSVLRYWLSTLVDGRLGGAFPWGTLFVNVTGSFVIGFIATATGTEGRWLAPVAARQFLMVGICGGYTTFSSFSLQTLRLVEDGQWGRAGANCAASVVLCMLAVAIGHWGALYIGNNGSSR